MTPAEVEELVSSGQQGKEVSVMGLPPMKHCPYCDVMSREDRCFVDRRHVMRPGPSPVLILPAAEETAFYASFAAMWRGRFNPPATNPEPFVCP